MKNILKTLQIIRKGVKYLDYISKAAQTAELLSKHVNIVLDEIEKIWSKELNKKEEPQNETI